MKKLIFFQFLIFFSQFSFFDQGSVPAKAYIKGVPENAQKFSLSCESRSAVDWAAFWGVKISETKFLRQLPLSDNPEIGFVGNPSDPWGEIPPRSYGVHAGPVANLLKKYGFDVYAIKGMKWKELQFEIASGRPVIVWVIGQMVNGTPIEFRTKAGKKVTVANYEHTMIIIGYDRKYVYAIDAFSGKEKAYSKKAFLLSWSTLGNMAITGKVKIENTKNITFYHSKNGASRVLLPLILSMVCK